MFSKGVRVQTGGVFLDKVFFECMYPSLNPPTSISVVERPISSLHLKNDTNLIAVINRELQDLTNRGIQQSIQNSLRKNCNVHD